MARYLKNSILICSALCNIALSICLYMQTNAIKQHDVIQFNKEYDAARQVHIFIGYQNAIIDCINALNATNVSDSAKGIVLNIIAYKYENMRTKFKKDSTILKP
jgi:hypothetical protein